MTASVVSGDNPWSSEKRFPYGCRYNAILEKWRSRLELQFARHPKTPVKSFARSHARYGQARPMLESVKTGEKPKQNISHGADTREPEWFLSLSTRFHSRCGSCSSGILFSPHFLEGSVCSVLDPH